MDHLPTLPLPYLFKQPFYLLPACYNIYDYFRSLRYPTFSLPIQTIYYLTCLLQHIRLFWINNQYLTSSLPIAVLTHYLPITTYHLISVSFSYGGSFLSLTFTHATPVISPPMTLYLSYHYARSASTFAYPLSLVVGVKLFSRLIQRRT